jgi:hypothetical protein
MTELATALSDVVLLMAAARTVVVLLTVNPAVYFADDVDGWLPSVV